MARTQISVQQITTTGLNPTYDVAIVDGHSFVNDGGTVLHVKNGDATSKTITIQTPAKVDGLDVAELTVSIPAGESRFIGRFLPSVYNQSDGLVYIDYSAVTSVTVAVLKR